MASFSKITPCLWFDSDGEEAARFYCGIFPDSRIVSISHYSDEGREHHGKPAGAVLTVSFTLAGQSFTALNGGPRNRFTEAVSLQVMCDTQAEIDHYWSRLGEDGGGEPVQCGWLKDRFGLSWQIVPSIVDPLLTQGDAAKAERVLKVIMDSVKLDIAALERAAAG